MFGTDAGGKISPVAIWENITSDVRQNTNRRVPGGRQIRQILAYVIAITEFTIIDIKKIPGHTTLLI